jgi:hypothetical protein
MNIFSNITKNMKTTLIKSKELHLMKPPRGVYHLFKLFMSILGENYSHSVIFHERSKNIDEVIPKAILPKEYGGDGGTIEEICDHWYNLLASKKDNSGEGLQYGIIESLRPKKQSRFGRMYSSFTNFFHSHTQQS